MGILVQNVYKSFGDFQALNNINLEIKDGTIVALLGPSGSGKSTLLRGIAGLDNPDTGKIIINGVDSTNVDVKKRNIGFVFQHYALFKHLTIRQNIAFGLEIRKVSPKIIKERVKELLELIQLEGLGDRYPSQLSGGQRQRVALARALAVQPGVLLLDEPFGALDAKVRKELRTWLRRLHDQVHLTSVFVTHDQEEAMEVADEIVVMSQGKIEQVGTPADIYDNPTTPFVMSFIGEVNVLPRHSLWFKNYPEKLESDVFIRPHEFDIQTELNGSNTKAQIKRITHLGWEVQIELILPDNLTVFAHLSKEKFTRLNLRTEQFVFIKPLSAQVFNEDETAKKFVGYDFCI